MCHKPFKEGVARGSCNRIIEFEKMALSDNRLSPILMDDQCFSHEKWSPLAGIAWYIRHTQIWDSYKMGFETENSLENFDVSSKDMQRW